MANIVGISTLAFTTDDYLLMGRAKRPERCKREAARAIWQRQPRAKRPGRRPGRHHSQQRRTPTGPSGHWARPDMAATSLQEVLRLGMERELAEETGVSADKIRGTRVGFGRWWNVARGRSSSGLRV